MNLKKTMYSVQGYKCVCYGIIMYSFQKNKVCELTSSVFCSSLCLFRRNNYTFSVVSLGRLWNIPIQRITITTLFHWTAKKGSRISMPKLDHEMLRDYFGGNLWRSGFFSDPVRVLSIGRSSIQVLLIRSHPVLVLSIPSDPIYSTRSWFCKHPYGIHLRDSKTKGLSLLFYCCSFFNRLLILLVSISRSGPLQKYFKSANIYNFLLAFHTFLYKIGGHVYGHFVVKLRA